MSILGHRRRIQRLEQRSGSKQDPWVEAVYETEREVQATRKAVAALVEFALVLAGTDRMPMARIAAAQRDAVNEPVPRADRSFLRRGGRQVWSEAVRPGPNDVLTWEEAMRVPWLDANAEAERQRQSQIASPA